METPKKPAKKTSASKAPAKKAASDKPAPKPKRFVDDDEDEDEFGAPIDELGGFDHFDGLEEEEEDY